MRLTIAKSPFGVYEQRHQRRSEYTMTQNNHTDNKPCIVCESSNEREATDDRIDAHGGVLEYLSNYAVFNAELTPDRTRLFLVDGCDAVFAVWLQKQHVARLIAELQALHDQMP